LRKTGILNLVGGVKLGHCYAAVNSLLHCARHAYKVPIVNSVIFNTAVTKQSISTPHKPVFILLFAV
jgi:hypothetical protein